MFRADLTYPTVNINSLKSAVYSDLAKKMRKRGRVAVRVAKARVGVDTGLLKRSIHMEQRSRYTVPITYVGSDIPYALMHHTGTRRHVIRPKKPGGVLVFKGRSGIVRTKKVMHPRVRANRYLRDALIAAARRPA